MQSKSAISKAGSASVCIQAPKGHWQSHWQSQDKEVVSWPCRFDRENFIIVPQVRRFGYRFHADGRRFDRVTDSEAWLSGSGYALQQLTWDREAYIMANNYTARSFLPGSVMEHLKAKNVQ